MAEDGLVKRLRLIAGVRSDAEAKLMAEAADEIEYLREKRAKGVFERTSLAMTGKRRKWDELSEELKSYWRQRAGAADSYEPSEKLKSEWRSRDWAADTTTSEEVKSYCRRQAGIADTSDGNNTK